jgi:hypothetical protein
MYRETQLHDFAIPMYLLLYLIAITKKKKTNFKFSLK